MNFFEAQEQAQRKSRLLVIYFVLAILAIVIGVNLAAYFAFFAVATQEGASHAAPPQLADPIRWLWISLITVGVILGASLIRSAQLKQGGGYVARSVGGRRVEPTTRDPLEKRLLNVVEEMAIASGVPMPEVYVLDQESGINAFAAGHDPNDAAVAVTRGTLESLSRDELQGVIAHEFSHILNGDMRINIRMIGVLFGILMIAILGRIFLHASAGSRAGSGNRGKGGGGAIVLFGLAVMIIGFFGEFFGRLIQAALSRQREYLADAAAVQFTRNPAGIAGALKTIGGTTVHGRIENQRAAGMAHCFFASALTSKLGGALSTHPPLPKRIRAIEPQWDGTYVDPAKKRQQSVAKPDRPKPSGSGLGRGQRGDAFIQGATLLAGVGSLGQQDVNAASVLLQKWPDELREAIHDPIGAVAVLLLLVLEDAETPRGTQLDLIRDAVDQRVFDAVSHLSPIVGARQPNERLALAELALPVLRNLPEPRKHTLYDLIDQLILEDRRATLYEFCLATLIEFRLGRKSTPGSGVTPLPQAVGRLLSKVASLDAPEVEEARVIFEESVSALQGRLAKPSFYPPERISFRALQGDLEALRQSPLPLRKAFLQACEKAIRRDAQISDKEADLFRVIAVCIDCPVSLSR